MNSDIIMDIVIYIFFFLVDSGLSVSLSLSLKFHLILVSFFSPNVFLSPKMTYHPGDPPSLSLYPDPLSPLFAFLLSLSFCRASSVCSGVRFFLQSLNLSTSDLPPGTPFPTCLCDCVRDGINLYFQLLDCTSNCGWRPCNLS